MARPREPRIGDLAKHPRPAVSLTVAAEYLGINYQTVRARVEAGELPAVRDGKVYRIPTKALAAYIARRDRD